MALPPATVLHDTWQIRKVIGKGYLLQQVAGDLISYLIHIHFIVGSFSSIYIAKTIAKSRYTEDEYVAIKVQNGDVDASVLRWESEVLKSLSQEHSTTVPR